MYWRQVSPRSLPVWVHKITAYLVPCPRIDHPNRWQHIHLKWQLESLQMLFWKLYGTIVSEISAWAWTIGGSLQCRINFGLYFFFIVGTSKSWKWASAKYFGFFFYVLLINIEWEVQKSWFCWDYMNIGHFNRLAAGRFSMITLQGSNFWHVKWIQLHLSSGIHFSVHSVTR